MQERYFYWLLFIVALLGVSFTQHEFQRCYREEISTSTLAQGLAVIQNHASAFDEEPTDSSHQEEHSAAASASSSSEIASCPVCSHRSSNEINYILKHTHKHVNEQNQEHEGESEHVHAHVHARIHTHTHEHEHEHEDEHGQEDPTVSTGFVLMLRQLGFAELAANLLWIQMDADSHRGLMHRVEFALELIPALDPTFIEAYLLHAFMLDEYQNRHEEALQILEKAVKQNPNRLELWEQIGLYCLNFMGRHGPKRDLQKALAAFVQAGRFSDAPPYITRMIAISLAALERREEAIQVLQQALQDPNRPEDQKQIDRNLMQRIQSGEKF